MPADCAPTLPPQVASTIYVCRSGTCARLCTTDLTCGGQGVICRDGLCEASDCATLADCPSGQYCTSATFGRCLAFETCTTSTECQPNARCERFSMNECPPGFDCSRSICRELPRCFIDADCVSGVPAQQNGYCAEGHCQPSTRCMTSASCASGRECIGGVCVPSICRGQADCGAGQSCTPTGCVPSPMPTELARLGLHPDEAMLVVGDTLQLQLTGYRLDQSTSPLASGTFTVLDEQGMPSANVTVTQEGLVTAIAAGRVVVRAQVMMSFASPTEMRLVVVPRVSMGRRVIVVDAPTRRPLSQVVVGGCIEVDCTDVTTGADGVALFPALGAAAATFTAVSPALRMDGRPTWERVSVLLTRAQDVLLPLRENPVRATSGFNGSVGFQQVRASGTYWIGLIATSISDLPAMRLSRLLGDPVLTEIDGLNQRVPVPGAVVLYTSPAFNIPQDVKPRSLGFGQPGRRAAVAFATRGELTELATLRSVDLLSYVGSADFTLTPSVEVTTRLDVPDTTDVNGNGLCTNPQRCPMGSEDVADWAGFTRVTLAPNQVLSRRTAITVPRVPSTLDTVVVAGVQLDAFRGATPTGFASKTAGAPAADGTRPVDAMVLRSGVPFGGLESTQSAFWSVALSTRSSAETGRVFKPIGSVPSAVALQPFLPLPGTGSFSSSARQWLPSAASWSSLYSTGAEVGRVAVIGSQVRHTIYFALEAGQVAVAVPAPPAGPGLDPASEAMEVGLEVVAVDLSTGITFDGLLSAEGVNLTNWVTAVDGYSRVDR